jgi:hypothetical protein
MDTVRAGESDHRTEGMRRVHAGHAVVSADALVQMDADQVHIGCPPQPPRSSLSVASST